MVPPYHMDTDLLDLSENNISETTIQMLKSFETKNNTVKY